MSFGWAYVGCDDIAITSMTGPSGSILVRTGTNSISGSANYKLLDEGNQIHSLLMTGSVKVKGNTTMTGNLTVAGNLIANSYRAVHTTVTEIETSGSTTFGNDYNDRHVLTGSFLVAGGAINTEAGGTTPALIVSASHGSSTQKIGILTKAPTSHFSVSGSMALNYRKVSSALNTLASTDIIVGVTRTSATTVLLPTANNAPGQIVIVKDEGLTQPRTSGNKITIATVGSETIDGQPNYEVFGSRVAISLYSNGADGWFVF